MSNTHFGLLRTQVTFLSAETAVSATPNFQDSGAAPAFEYYGSVVEALERRTAIVVEIAQSAEAQPAPVAPETLQDLVQAARARLARERARRDREQHTAALDHVRQLRELTRP